jgi:DNA-binding transcriptional regulator/RsmH inhibitor MraZ
MVADAVFYGPSALAMDAKGRFAMPTRHRDALMQLCAPGA